MAANHAAHHAAPRAGSVLRAGIYAPIMTFFDPDTEDVQPAVIGQHVVRLAAAGLVGLVTLGSNGEAVHLNRAERTLVTRSARAALDDAGWHHVSIIAGCSEQSIRGTLELCRDARRAGASHALIVPPSYFRAAMDLARLRDFFVGVADQSPLPIIIYNYPGAVAGIDLDSDVLVELAQHPNIVGTKFTCGNTGKLTRVAAATSAVTATRAGSGYMAFGGMADFTLQTAVSQGSGIIAGGANVLPRLCVKVWKLWEAGKLAEAMDVQQVLSRGDWVLTKGAVPGTKKAIELEHGYGGNARRPLKRLSADEVEELRNGMAEAMKAERSLPDFGVRAD